MIAKSGQPEVGSLFADRYEILEKIGEGGMANVFKVADRELGSVCALKILTPALADKPGVRRRFEREAVALGRTAHPHIVHVLNHGEWAGQLFLVMEFLPGGTLREMIVRSKVGLEPIKACAITICVLRALSLAHERGIVHRDIKPPNILFDAFGIPKVADFGVAHASGDSGLTRAGAIVGSFWFMAPEQNKVQEAPGPAADIFAVGVTLHAMLLGLVEAPAPFFYETLQEDPTIMKEIPAVFASVILMATRRDPRQRYTSAIEMIAALEEARSRFNNVGLPSRQETGGTVIPMDEGIMSPPSNETCFGWSGSGRVSSEEGASIPGSGEKKTTPPPIVLRGEEKPILPEAAPPGLASMAGVDDHEPDSDDTPAFPIGRRSTGVGVAIGLVGILAIALLTIGLIFWLKESENRSKESEGPEVVEDAMERRPETTETASSPGASEPAVETPPVQEVPSVVRASPRGMKKEKPAGEPATARTPPTSIVGEPMPSAPARTRVTLSGNVKDVRLVGDEGSYPLPAEVPAGTYRVVAQFSPDEEAVVVIRGLKVAGKPVAIACDSDFALCNRL